MEPNAQATIPNGLVGSAFDLLTRTLGLRRASLLWRASADREVMRIIRARGLDHEVVHNSRIRLGEPIGGLVAQQCEPLLVGDITRHAEFAGARRSGYSSLSFASVPILSDGQAVGVLNATEKEEDEAPFSERDLAVLVGFAAHIRECAESEEREALAREQPPAQQRESIFE
jgi:signal transduction protein with GAF and PtsI domain